MPQSSIEKLVEETIQSIEGVKRAVPRPYLSTRLQGRLLNHTGIQNTWTWLGAFLSRPIIAFTGILLILLINAAILIVSKPDPDKFLTEQAAESKDEFAMNVISIYDNENTEP